MFMILTTFPGACGPTTYSAARRTMPCRPCSTFTSGTRLWVRRAVWPWWAPAGIFLRPALASWSSTFRSAKLSARLRRTHTKHAFSPRLPLLTSRHKSTRRTRSSAPDCERFSGSRVGQSRRAKTELSSSAGTEVVGRGSRRLHLKGLKNVWTLVTQLYEYARIFHSPQVSEIIWILQMYAAVTWEGWIENHKRDTGR